MDMKAPVQLPPLDDSAITFGMLVRTFKRNLRFISICVAAFAVIGVAIALLQPVAFRATVVFALVAPPFSDQQGSLGGMSSSLGAFGRIAGLALGGPDSSLQINLESLKSNQLIREFLESEKLTGRVAAAARPWWSSNPDNSKVRQDDIVEYFRTRVRTITPSTANGVFQLQIEWGNAQEASAWANAFLEFANGRLRADAVARGERRLQFLRQRLQSETVVTIQESLARLIADEMKGLALAADVDAYAFRVIDRATPPTRRAKPQRLLILLLAMVSGAVLSFFFVLARDSAHGRLNA